MSNYSTMMEHTKMAAMVPWINIKMAAMTLPVALLIGPYTTIQTSITLGVGGVTLPLPAIGRGGLVFDETSYSSTTSLLIGLNGRAVRTYPYHWSPG
jgi:hypothetical protein